MGRDRVSGEGPTAVLARSRTNCGRGIMRDGGSTGFVVCSLPSKITYPLRADRWERNGSGSAHCCAATKHDPRTELWGCGWAMGDLVSVGRFSCVTV